MPEYTLALSEVEVARYRMMAERARVEEADAWTAAGIVPGARVADVGCGPAAALVAMAEVVGPSGSVAGVDADPSAIAAAEQVIAQSGVANADVRLGAAGDTGLPAGSFDVVVMRHVLAHNGGHEQAIVDHLATLTRPGGCVYLVDVELTAIRLLGADDDLVELLERYAAFQRRRGNDPQIGLKLGALLAAAGLEVVSHTGVYRVLSVQPGIRPPAWAARDAMVAQGDATAEDLVRWGAALDRLDAAPERPQMFMPAFAAIGRRPG